MTSAESPDDAMRALARTADAIAGRVRPWQIGHELAKDLTVDGRQMTQHEVAVVQALETSLDWSSRDGDRQFRPWWLDDDASLDEVDAEWIVVWAGVVAVSDNPTIVAHLSDLLWVARHGTRHLHARRAIDAYLQSASMLDERHDRSRSVMRAHELAGAINDGERRRLVEGRLCAEAGAAIAEDDLSVAIALLDHLVARRLSPDAASTADQLLQRGWRVACRADHIERLGKLLLSRTDEESDKQVIADRVVSTFLERSANEEGFGRLIALRDALRVAEELGHVSHDEILHEIETLDSESAFTAIRTEQVMSRQDVAAFCAGVVGADSLGHALVRFARQLPITPESVQRTRDQTPLGVRHMVTSYRIGEANSVVTSTETAGPDEDPIGAALERDVRQSVGVQAQLSALAFLVPALHQVLEAYEPWTVADVRALVVAGPADVVVADAFARSLEHFHHRRYDEAIHVALPRVERLVRHIARSCGVATTRRATKRVGGIRALGEIINDLRGGGDAPILPEPLLTCAELTLVDADALNLRNEFLHGINDQARSIDAALILQVGLALALTIEIRSIGSEASTP